MLYLVCNVACYLAGGIEALGFAYLIWYFGYALIVAAVCYKVLGITPGRKVTILCVTVVLISIVTALLVDRWIVISITVTAFAVGVSCKRISGLLHGKHGN